jgi:hypothetical protein
MEAPIGFFNLYKQQWEDANEQMQARLFSYAHFLNNWRGRYSYEDEERNRDPEAGGSTSLQRMANAFWSDTAGLVAPRSTDRNYTPQVKIFVRETYRHVEATIARWDQAFTSPARAFELSMPRIYKGTVPPSKDEMQSRKDSLDGLSDFLSTDFRRRGSKENTLITFRSVGVLGTGFSYIKEARAKEPYPRGIVENLAPWRMYEDPYAPNSSEWRYAFIEHLYDYSDTLRYWPKSAEAIRKAMTAGLKDAASQGFASLDPSRTTKRQMVRVWEYWAYLPDDIQALDDEALGRDIAERQAARPETLQRCFLLGDKASGAPSREILDGPVPNPYTHNQIPIVDWSVLRSLKERGCRGIGLADQVDSDQHITNVLANLLVLQQALATRQAGFVDSYYGDLAQKANRPFKPGEIRPVNTGGKPIKDLIQLLQFPDVSESHLALLDYFHQDSARTTVVTDQTAGISTRTFSGTAAEAGLLQQESNVRFRFSAERLDTSFQRMLELYIGTTADALKGYYGVHVEPFLISPPPGQTNVPFLWFLNENDDWRFINPQAFDQPWEIELKCGGTWVDRRQKAEELKQMAQLGLALGVPVMALEVMRQACSLQGLDADGWLPTPEQVAAAQSLPPAPPVPPPHVNVNFQGNALPEPVQQGLLGGAPPQQPPPQGPPMQPGGPQLNLPSTAAPLPAPPNMPGGSQ